MTDLEGQIINNSGSNNRLIFITLFVLLIGLIIVVAIQSTQINEYKQSKIKYETQLNESTKFNQFVVGGMVFCANIHNMPYEELLGRYNKYLSEVGAK